MLGVWDRESSDELQPPSRTVHTHMCAVLLTHAAGEGTLSSDAFVAWAKSHVASKKLLGALESVKREEQRKVRAARLAVNVTTSTVLYCTQCSSCPRHAAPRWTRGE